MDCVKAKAWKDFIVKNSILPPAYDRVIKEDDNPTPFCISLKNVEGIEVVSKANSVKLYINELINIISKLLPLTGEINDSVRKFQLTSFH